MKRVSTENEEVLHLFLIAAASIGAVLTTIFSLTHGIVEIFPFLYILPIILVIYFFPKRAVIFSLVISLLYIGIVYILSDPHSNVIAISTAWFAIFIVIGVVASSYANKLLDERTRIHQILENSQDGIFCFDPRNMNIRVINVKCARWLRYDRRELVGKDIAVIWPDEKGLKRFVEEGRDGTLPPETEALFRARDGTMVRFVVSAVLVSRERILCSVIDLTGSKIADEEIRKTLDDLEEQVRARTAHLEQINEELRAEILLQRRRENLILSGEEQDTEDERR